MSRRYGLVASALRVLAAVPLVIALSGCTLPPSMQLISLAANGISYLTLGKSVADTGISAVVQKDCALLRVIRSEKVCAERGTVAVEAVLASVPLAATRHPAAPQPVGLIPAVVLGPGRKGVPALACWREVAAGGREGADCGRFGARNAALN